MENTNKEDKEDQVEILNSYDNTDELSKEFQIVNKTSIEPGIETKIQNRLLTGFANWNRGIKAWKKWGNILYTQDSIYNVHGARLTLSQYQASMNAALSKVQIFMGNFNNMLIIGNWTAIFYDVTTKVGPKEIYTRVMEFVLFKDYGEELGTRVVEGWGGTKDHTYDNMLLFQGEKEKEIQKQQTDEILNYKITDFPELEKKYPVKNPTPDKGKFGKEIRDIIFKGIDSWNHNLDEWTKWVNDVYTNDADIQSLIYKKRTVSEYIDEMKELCKTNKIRKLFFDNIMIDDTWAAIHYRYTKEDLSKEGDIYVGDRMLFLKFIETENGLKISETWVN